jgi:hypothetical protein
MPVAHDCEFETLLRRPFLAALLLAGNSESAEIAVFESLCELEAHPISTDALLLGSVAVALRLQAELDHTDGRSPEEQMFLPPALRRVLRLSHLPRSCFVLRTLEALPRETCARLLRIDVDAVDLNAGIAAGTLAELSGKDGTG